MSHYKAYSKYKDSGLDWIDEVPKDWDVKPIKIVASHNDDSLDEMEEANMPIRYVDISSVSHDEGISKAEEMLFGSAPSRARRKAKAGDVIISTVRTYLKAVAAVDDIHADCVYSTGFVVLRARPNQVIPGFLKWLALNEFFIQSVESNSEGLSYPAINAPALVSLKTTIPSLSEQAVIAPILDSETARIDAIIAKKTQFIELLNEKILAMVTHSIEHKDTRIIRLQHVCDVISRPVSQQDGESYTRLGLYNCGRGAFKKTEADNEDMGDSDFFWVEENDLILSGQFALEGAVAMATKEHANCVVSHRFPVIQGRQGESLTEYLFALFMTHFGDFILSDCSRGSAGRNRPLNLNALLLWKIPVPSIEYQKKIALLIHLRESIRVKTQHSINLLKERRSALITAAVTGQIDLREST